LNEILSLTTTDPNVTAQSVHPLIYSLALCWLLGSVPIRRNPIRRILKKYIVWVNAVVVEKIDTL